ncbi:MAG: GTP cyclohydrolase II [Alphaproteobacteria bacterium]|nr:MAG: GTP cyclohydrolase II [Alphaproteobacteria bacterium]
MSERERSEEQAWKANLRIRRAVSDLRFGAPVRISAPTFPRAGLLVAPADALAGRGDLAQRIAARFLSADAVKESRLWLTPERASSLHLPVKGRGVVAIACEQGMSAATIAGLADPTRDLEQPLRGPFRRCDDEIGDEVEQAAVALFALLKAAGRLPAALVAPACEADRRNDWTSLDPGEVARFLARPPSVEETVRAQLPLAAVRRSRIVAFRADDGASEHFAILIGDPTPHEPVLVRLHSECFTGDHLGSLKCDCGDQLQGALERLAGEPGGGVLLYLAQEGRGIGLVAKLKAYALQDQGFDTVDANLKLGFAVDERAYGVAAAMLKHLRFTRIRLLTNNPDKVRQLADHGIEVVERVAHRFPARPENEEYLAAKRDRTGHFL